MSKLERYLRHRQERLGTTTSERRAKIQALRRRIQTTLTESQDFKGMTAEAARPLVEERAWSLLHAAADGEAVLLALSREEKSSIIQRILASMFGLGPLEDLVNSRDVTEIMVNGPSRIFVERRVQGHRAEVGRAQDPFGEPLAFDDGTELLTTIERIVAPISRKVDESTPIVDARLKNGSRVNVVLSPISLDGHAVTIRTFPDPITIEKLVAIGSLPEWLADLLGQMVRARYNLVVSGGTGSGKTTFLNALSNFVGDDERVVTVEDAAELQLQQVENIVRLEARPPNLEGKGAIPIRDLVKTALRMRPDRIIVGEVRGGEALDMLQAMNTGHDGSMTTGHANSTLDMLSRLETMVLMSGLELPLPAIRHQIASAVDFIIQLSRMPDRSRKVVQVTEVLGVEHGEMVTREIAVRDEDGQLRVVNAISRLHKFRLSGRIPDSVAIRSEEGG